MQSTSPPSSLDDLPQSLGGGFWRGFLSQQSVRSNPPILDGQVDDGDEKVMLVPVPQVRLPEVLEALGGLPESEDFTMEEE